MSRYEKIPLYVSWIKADVDNEIVSKYLIKFSKAVKQKVIESDWVPGALDFLKNNPDPKEEDIYSYGCLSKILQLLKLPDGTVKVLVEGVERVKIKSI